MPTLTTLLVLLGGLLDAARRRYRSSARPDNGEGIVTWVILTAALAVITLAIVAIIGQKLRATAEGLELE
jgi:hypothetical protein